MLNRLTKMNWKRSLNLRQDEAVGLDIGSSSVKVVQLRRNGRGYTVTAAGIVPIQPDQDASDQVGGHHLDANTARAISQCLQSAEVQTKLAVCSVCGPEVAVRDFKFPSLPPEELEGAVTLEAGQSCPFDMADGVIDYQVTSQDQSGIRGVLVAATNAVIGEKLQLAKKASVDCILMDIDGLALLNCLGEYEPRQPGYAAAILNVGRSYTTLAIVGDNELPFIRDMAYAGDHIIEQIAAQTGQVKETVTAILSGQQECQFDLRDHLEKACERLIIDVNETLRFYTAQEKLSIAKVHVCGGFALVGEFIEILNRRLAVKAVLWNPFDENSKFEIRDSKFISADILQKNGPAMAVAAGLATRSI
jgi:type IV pilus assembly protein PilM